MKIINLILMAILLVFSFTMSSCNKENDDTIINISNINEIKNNDSTKTYQVTLDDGTVLTFTTNYEDVTVKTVTKNTDGSYLITLSNDVTYTIEPDNSYGEVTNIEFNNSIKYLNVTETIDLELLFLGEGFNKDLVIWNSSNENVLVANGKIVGVSSGYSVITATYKDLTTSCYVIVIDNNNKGFSISNEKIMLDNNSSKEISILLNGTTYENVLWTSSDNNVAIVKNGIISSVNPGECIITAEVHGVKLCCHVVVSGVDGNLADWIYNNQELYDGITISDALHEERYCRIFARITDDGIYYGGYAYHATHSKNQNMWHQNTNFEVFLYQDNKSIQYYASEGFRSSGATSYIKTIENIVSTSEYNKYYTIFEVFVPVKITGNYIGTSVAFKTPGEYISQVVGNQHPELISTDWWWKDLHYPGNKNELYYVYETGIYGGVLNEKN